MDRVSFVDSISGIQYPELIVQFFDHFMVLREIIQDTGTVSVIRNTQDSILFLVEFADVEVCQRALDNIPSTGCYIMYDKQIHVGVEILTDKIIQIQLH